jgi:hypothetical protein
MMCMPLTIPVIQDNDLLDAVSALTWAARVMCALGIDAGRISSPKGESTGGQLI